MSAPSDAHETRTADLEALAALCGANARVCLGIGVEPDVVRVDLSRRILFLGDAKATETPNSWATRQRLARYAAAAVPVALAGADVVFAIAHPFPVAKEWRRLLIDLVGSAGLVLLSKSSCKLDARTIVTAVTAVAPPGRSVNRRGYDACASPRGIPSLTS